MVTRKADSFVQTNTAGTCLYGIQSMLRWYFRGCRLSGSPDTLKMAVAFENCDVVLSEEREEHINDRHVRLDLHPRASQFN